jgi:D-alanyl-D-alanine carboxypeptidase
MLVIALRCAALALPLAVSLHAQSAPLSREQVVAALGRHLDSLARADRFAGVVLLADGDSVIFERAYGLANRERRRPADVNTRYNLGSINKAFTSTAIRQLAAQGRLALDDRLIQHLPDYPNRAVAEAVTLRQLMEHSAGIGGNVFGEPAGGTRLQLRTNNDFIPLFANEPPVFAPGSSRRYCNACYVLLGAVVERVSGMDYHQYVRRNIYAPAGMTATDSYARDSLPPNTAIGYTRGEDRPATAPLAPNTPMLPGRGSAAGGGYSTARDLLRFVVASRTGQVPQGPRGFGIAGGAPGTNAIVDADMRGRYTLVVLANMDPPVAEDLARVVRGWLGARDD